MAVSSSSQSYQQFLNTDLGEVFSSLYEDEPNEEKLLRFLYGNYDMFLNAKAQVRASFFALLLEVVSRPRTPKSDELQLTLSRANTVKDKKSIELAKEAVETDRNERAPPVEGETIGRLAMVELIAAFKTKVQENLAAEKEAAKAAKSSGKSGKTKEAAAAAAVEKD